MRVVPCLGCRAPRHARRTSRSLARVVASAPLCGAEGVGRLICWFVGRLILSSRYHRRPEQVPGGCRKIVFRVRADWSEGEARRENRAGRFRRVGQDHGLQHDDGARRAGRLRGRGEDGHRARPRPAHRPPVSDLLAEEDHLRRDHVLRRARRARVVEKGVVAAGPAADPRPGGAVPGAPRLREPGGGGHARPARRARDLQLRVLFRRPRDRGAVAGARPQGEIGSG